MAKARRKRAVRKKAKGAGAGGWVMLPLLPLLLAFFYPDMAIVLVIGMVPSVVSIAVSYGVDRGPKLMTISLFNLSGVIPILMDLQGPRYSGMGVMAVITDVYAWFVMYGAAGIGIAANWIGPFFAAAILSYLGRIDAHKLKVTRAQLVKEWGDSLTKEERVES